MADQKRWFKVWTSIVANGQFAEMSLEDIGRWALLGAATALDGDDGRLEIPGSGRELCRILRVPDLDAAHVVLNRIISVQYEEGTNDRVTAVVTFKNWRKYQIDSTQVKRQKASRYKRRGEEKRREKTRKDSTPRPLSPANLDASNGHPPPLAWGTPAALAALYNAEAPDECPAVQMLAPARKVKARQYLAAFPDEAWWREVFTAIRHSRFLRGLSKRPGHDSFVADFDWLLTKGKDGTENCVKVHDGRYYDG